VFAIDHRHRAEEPLPADVLLAQIAKADAGLTNVAAARVLDP
jgi:hypothetical protein